MSISEMIERDENLATNVHVDELVNMKMGCKNGTLTGRNSSSSSRLLAILVSTASLHS